MTISDTLKKYVGLGILVLMCALVVSMIALIKCNASYKKKIKTQQEQITTLQETIKFKEKLVNEDARIERTTQGNINKIISADNSGIVDMLNKLYKSNVQAYNNTAAGQADASER
jgi:CHASE3 domain sensor protein